MSDSQDPPRLKDLEGASASLLRDATRVPVMSGEDRAAIFGSIGAATVVGASAGTTTTATQGAGATSAAGGGAGATSAAGAGAGATSAAGALTSKGLLVGVASVVVAGAVVASFVLASGPKALPGPSASVPSHAASAIDAPRGAIEAPSEPPPAPSGMDEEAPPAPQPVEALAAGAQEATPAAGERRASPGASAGGRASAAAASARARAASSSESGGAGESSLAEESALVGKARGVLESNPQASLALLDEHRRRHPRGELAAEREFLSIKALRRVGRVDDARARARSYPARYPSSPYRPAVQSILAELGGP